ncbi:MAG TPA: glycosyltransferase family 39 protein [Pyrinomonadaceae bacterium]|nr:glycosyltransferase family 39 protein [Pyrinomonadaceae bacterium]
MERSLELTPEETAGVEVSPAATTVRGERRALSLDRGIVLVLVLVMLLGLALRVRGLSELGFAEDEINKLEAVRAYARGDITPNAEHPMLMKTLIFISLGAAEWWNSGQYRNEGAQATKLISVETAVRFPNVLFGALTIFPLYLLTASFFGKRTGLVAALLWSFGVNAITYNRIAKEDTLLVFFMLFAFYFYLRAKQTSGYEPRAKRKFYLASAVSFGLMLASKYFPHYFGLNMLYHHLVAQREREPGEPRGRTPAIFYPVVILTFLIANPAVLLPQTWHYLTAYSSEELLTHHGYLMGDTLYANQMSSTPFGTPFYFYLLFLAIKTPLPLLIALVAGLVACVRRWRRPGEAFLLLMFILWIVPYSIVGAKWLRYALSLLPFIYMLAAVGIMWLLTLFAPRETDGKRGSSFSPLRIVRAVVFMFFIALPAWIAYAAAPHYATYTNALGFGRAGYFFPHDEFYDDGLREAIKYVATTAPPNASIVHETPGVARYYLQKFSRADLNSRVLSDPAFEFGETPRPAYVILQRGRTYFENREKMQDARTRGHKVYEGFVGGLSAVEVYEVK